MANVRNPISVFWGGVSRQPETIRHASQVEEGDNVVFNVATGAEKRPGSVMRFAIPTPHPIDENYRMHRIIRDVNERYLILYGKGILRIFTLDGGEASIEMSAGAETYFNLNAPTADQIKLVTIADYTLLLNTTVPVAAKASASYVVTKTHRDFDVMISHTPAKDTRHKTKADTGARTAGYFLYGGFDGTFATWHRSKKTFEFPIPDYFAHASRNPGGFRVDFIRQPKALTAVTWNQAGLTLTKTGGFTNYTWFAKDQIYISAGTGSVVGWYDIEEKVDNDSIKLTASIGVDASDVATTNIGHRYEVIADMQTAALLDGYDVALQFQDALQAAGCDDGLIEWRYTGKYSGYFIITSPYRGVWDSVGTTIIDPIAPADGDMFDHTGTGESFASTSVVKVDGTGTVDTPTFAVLSRWTRIPAPNQKDALLDPTTMPCKMVRTSLAPLEFTVSLIAEGEGIPDPITGKYDQWAFRETGDEQTNPLPSLWEDKRKIADISLHRNRLVFSGDENVVFSQAGDFFNFFLADFDNIGDADPIDVPLPGETVALIDNVIPFKKSLLIFTKASNQFELSAPEMLSMNTANITLTTSYKSKENLRPTIMGDRVYFVAAQQGASQVLEYYYLDAQAPNKAADISTHVVGYIPSNIKSIQSILNNDTIFILPTDSNMLYVHYSFWDGDRRIQSAWGRDIFDDAETIHDIGSIEDDLWMLIQNADGYFVTSLPVPRTTSNEDYPYDVHLDNWVETLGSYNAGTGKTTWTLPVEDLSVDRAVLGIAFGAVATKTWTLSTDWTVADATKINGAGDQLTLLQHSANETFDAALDIISIWAVNLMGAATQTVEGGLLVLTAPANDPVSTANVFPETMRFGNFDFQIDFSSFAATVSTNRSVAQFRGIIDNENWFWIGRSRYLTNNLYQSTAIINGIGYSVDSATKTELSGKLRITRTGATITTYYWESGAWVQLQQRTDFPATGNARIDITLVNVDTTANSISCNFDNWTKNSGIPIYGYWQDTPYWDFDAIEPGELFAVHMYSAVATGTGTTQYRYATKTNGTYGSWSLWLTLAQLQIASNPINITGFKIQGRFASDGFTLATLSNFAIDYALISATDASGTVLNLTPVDSTHVNVDGDYSAHAVILGRAFEMNLQLSRPYLREQDASTSLDMTFLIQKLVLNHKDTGSYTVRIEQPLRTTRNYAFLPHNGELVEAEGSYQAFIAGNAEDTVISIVDSTPLPCTLATGEFVGTFTRKSY